MPARKQNSPIKLNKQYANASSNSKQIAEWIWLWNMQISNWRFVRFPGWKPFSQIDRRRQFYDVLSVQRTHTHTHAHTHTHRHGQRNTVPVSCRRLTQAHEIGVSDVQDRLWFLCGRFFTSLFLTSALLLLPLLFLCFVLFSHKKRTQPRNLTAACGFFHRNDCLIWFGMNGKGKGDFYSRCIAATNAFIRFTYWSGRSTMAESPSRETIKRNIACISKWMATEIHKT